MDTAKLINLYLNQGDHYHSSSKNDMIKITDMDASHAANAARLMLSEAFQWAVDAGKPEISNSAAYWMINKPLWKALIHRAQGLI